MWLMVKIAGIYQEVAATYLSPRFWEIVCSRICKEEGA